MDVAKFQQIESEQTLRSREVDACRGFPLVEGGFWVQFTGQCESEVEDTVKRLLVKGLRRISQPHVLVALRDLDIVDEGEDGPDILPVNLEKRICRRTRRKGVL